MIRGRAGGVCPRASGVPAFWRCMGVPEICGCSDGVWVFWKCVGELTVCWRARSV